MRLLLVLVQRARQVVSRKELVERVWDNEDASDDSVCTSIYQLRKLLGDKSGRPQYIETIPKRGYRMLVEPEFEPAVPDATAAASQPAAPSPATPLPPATAAPLQRPALRSLAVLPLHSPDPGDRAAAEGFTAALITELARVPGLRVSSMTSVMRYANGSQRVAEIAQQLQVETLLEGVLLRSGDRVRIDCRLVDAARDCHVWAGTFERDTAPSLSVQSDVARAVARELRARVGGELLAERCHDFPADAVEACWRGRALLASQRPSNLLQAKLYFEHALAREPRFAAAHAGLASIHVSLHYNQHAGAPWAEHARCNARAALELDPLLGEAHAAKGLVLGFIDGDLAAAEAAYRRAFELRPQLVLARRCYALLLAVGQQSEEALHQLAEAARHDPLNVSAQRENAHVFFMLRRFDRAAEELLKVLARQPTSWTAHAKLAFIHWLRGNWSEVHATYRAAASACDTQELVTRFDDAFASGGAAGLYAAVASHLERRNPQHRLHLPELIATYTAAGDHARALHLLERGCAEGRAHVLLLLRSPYLDPLRAEPAFQALAARYCVPVARGGLDENAGLPSTCC